MLLTPLPFSGALPSVVIYSTLVAEGIAIVATIYAYLYLLHKDPNRLHTEATYLKVRQMEQRLLGDSRQPVAIPDRSIEDPMVIEGEVTSP